MEPISSIREIQPLNNVIGDKIDAWIDQDKELMHLHPDQRKPVDKRIAFLINGMEQTREDLLMGQFSTGFTLGTTYFFRKLQNYQELSNQKIAAYAAGLVLSTVACIMTVIASAGLFNLLAGAITYGAADKMALNEKAQIVFRKKIAVESIEAINQVLNQSFSGDQYFDKHHVRKNLDNDALLSIKNKVKEMLDRIDDHQINLQEQESYQKLKWHLERIETKLNGI